MSKVPDAELIEVLDSTPLHSPRQVLNLYSSPQHGELAYPNDINVDCPKCEGVRRHERGGKQLFPCGAGIFHYVAYTCTNCKKSLYVYGLKTSYKAGQYGGECTKIFQEPPFGRPIPSRLFKLIGEENRNHFLNARRAIARGLGIGAYAYYRRIVEDTKFDLIESIIQVAESTNAAPALIQKLKLAQREGQFTKSIQIVKESADIS